MRVEVCEALNFVGDFRKCIELRSAFGGKQKVTGLELHMSVVKDRNFSFDGLTLRNEALCA